MSLWKKNDKHMFPRIPSDVLSTLDLGGLTDTSTGTNYLMISFTKNDGSRHSAIVAESNARSIFDMFEDMRAEMKAEGLDV